MEGLSLDELGAVMVFFKTLFYLPVERTLILRASAIGAIS